MNILLREFQAKQEQEFELSTNLILIWPGLKTDMYEALNQTCLVTSAFDWNLIFYEPFSQCTVT